MFGMFGGRRPSADLRAKVTIMANIAHAQLAGLIVGGTNLVLADVWSIWPTRITGFAFASLNRAMEGGTSFGIPF